MEAVPGVLQELFSYTSVTVALVTTAAVFFAMALGIRGAVNILGVKALSAPASRSARIKLAIVGSSLLAAALILPMLVTPYVEQYRKEKLYGERNAKRIVTDGEDIYVLLDNGNIIRLDRKGPKLVDSGTNTKQIASAGGQILILKENGQLWTYSKLRKRQAGRDEFALKDSGTGTKKIAHAGETVYVLKNSGELWRVYPLHGEDDFAIQKDDYRKLDPVRERGYQTIDISSAGSQLYFLTLAGEIYAYLPYDPTAVPLDKRPDLSQGSRRSRSLLRLYDGGPEVVRSIFADGSTLYFIKTNGSVWRVEDQARMLWFGPSVIEQLSASHGTVYMRTMDGRILRYDARRPRVRPVTQAGAGNIEILSLGDRLYVIDEFCNVYRYVPVTLKRSG